MCYQNYYRGGVKKRKKKRSPDVLLGYIHSLALTKWIRGVKIEQIMLNLNLLCPVVMSQKLEL